MNKQDNKQNDMTISLKLRLVDIENSNLRAFANVTINDVLTIRNIKIVEGRNGLFASMPSVKDRNGYYDPVVSMEKEHYQKLSSLVVDDYRLVHDQAMDEAARTTPEDQGEAELKTEDIGPNIAGPADAVPLEQTM